MLKYYTEMYQILYSFCTQSHFKSGKRSDETDRQMLTNMGFKNSHVSVV